LTNQTENIIYKQVKTIKADNSQISANGHNGGNQMAIFEHGAIKIEIDDDGFMQNPELWNEDIAKALATTEGVENMTEEHWKLVNYLREYYLKFGIAPMIRKLCKETDLPLKKIYEMFPSGPAKGACKVAGLPKPTGCV